MIRLFEPVPAQPLYLLLLADVGAGLVALVLTPTLALFSGGFNFFQPWLFWGTMLLFLAGVARGRHMNLNVWVHAICINLTWFICIPFAVYAPRILIVATLLVALVPTASGLWVSRKRPEEQT